MTDSEDLSERSAEMTGKADFTEDEWARLKRAPFVAEQRMPDQPGKALAPPS